MQQRDSVLSSWKRARVRPSRAGATTALAVAAVTAALGQPTAARGATVFSADFTDGTSTGWSVVQQDIVGTDGVEGNTTTNATLGVVGNALQLSLTSGGTWDDRAAVVSFPDVTLNDTAHSITLAFDASWNNATARDRRFSFGLYNDQADADSEDDIGYHAKSDMASAAGTTGALFQTLEARRLFDGSSTALFAGSNTSNTASFVGSTSSRFALRIERVDDSLDATNNDLKLTYSVDGSEITSQVLSVAAGGTAAREPVTYTFNKLAIGVTDVAVAGQLLIDNVTVTAVVPEPSGLALLAVAGVATLRRRRL